VAGGRFYSLIILNIDKYFYDSNSQQFVGLWDLFSGVFKSLFFGAAIGLISCHHGFHCSPGAEGVGRAATKAFVASFVAILAIDLALNIMLESVYNALWPEGLKLF
jgi:phospholipid/cholesterol/gamma-HCH transport system permease protein